jgi:hypothetical protein
MPDIDAIMKTPCNQVAAVLMLSLCTLLSDVAISQTTTSSPVSESPPDMSRIRHRAKAGFLVPYHGIISGVDKNASTFTIEGRGKSRVLRIIDGTPITKNGETATINDIAKDDEVSGSYLKDSDGTLLARTVKIGPVKHKATPTPTASPKR